MHFLIPYLHANTLPILKNEGYLIILVRKQTIYLIFLARLSPIGKNDIEA